MNKTNAFCQIPVGFWITMNIVLLVFIMYRIIQYLEIRNNCCEFLGTSCRRQLIIWKFNASGCLTTLRHNCPIESLAYSKYNCSDDLNQPSSLEMKESVIINNHPSVSSNEKILTFPSNFLTRQAREIRQNQSILLSLQPDDFHRQWQTNSKQGFL